MESKKKASADNCASTSCGEKVALVTGSSSGIGAAIVKSFYKQNFKVVVSGIDQTEVDEVVAECIKSNKLAEHKPLGIALDFSDPTNGAELVKRTVAHFGRLDVLVNNAGIFAFTKPGSDNPLSSFELYKKVQAINVDASVSASLAAVEHLKKVKGCMVFVSSVGGIYAHSSTFAYSMSKSALTMFAKCLAIDVAPDIRVNIISPGLVETDLLEQQGIPRGMSKHLHEMTLANRLGQPEEIASLCDYLVSDSASYVTGQDFVIDGGYALRKFKAPELKEELRKYMRLVPIFMLAKAKSSTRRIFAPILRQSKNLR